MTSDLIKLEKVLTHTHNNKKHMRTISKYVFLFLKKWGEENIKIQNLLFGYYKNLL